MAAATLVAAAAIAAPSRADDSPAPVLFPDVEGAIPETRGVTVAVDADDDDENEVIDARQRADVPTRALRPFRLREEALPVRLRVEGDIRILRDGDPVSLPVTVSESGAQAEWRLQGVQASEHAGDAALIAKSSGRRTRIPVTVVGLSFLDARNRRIDARTGALAVSRAVTNDATLPRETSWTDPSPDPRNVRIELHDPALADHAEPKVTLEARKHPGAASRSELAEVPLAHPISKRPRRSPWLRLVTDTIDAEAPGVAGRVLQVGLRDVVRVSYATAGGTVHQALRVGRPGDENGPRAARRARLRVYVLRVRPGGRPVIGADDGAAREIAREQIAIANDVWAQCFLSFGSPQELDVTLVDPPPPTLLAVGNGDGLPARGGGVIRFRVDGQAIGPVETRAGAPPVHTALEIANAVEEAGFGAVVTENAPTEFGAGRSADISIRDPDGNPVTLSHDGEAPLTTDPRQSVAIGRVDLTDGLQEFGNMNATSGTLEERALLKTVTDGESSTIDLVLVNRFTGGTRQGEAFIESDQGAVVNTVLLDRNGLRQQRAAWTQAHEIGHVLLDQPYHPDNIGPDRPWLLMDADTALPLVTGPKRLTGRQCRQMRRQSGLDAIPPLLERMDARADPPSMDAHPPFDLGYPP